VNQYTVFKGPAGQKTLAYDHLGNLTNESLPSGDQQYIYDFLNRLVMYMDVGYNVTKYRYDALGRRISKNLNGWTHTRYVYDGDRLIQERDGTDGSSPGQVVLSYVYGVGSDEVLTRRRLSDSTDLFYHSNALGSVAAVTDGSGAVVERYKYDAYGQVTFLAPDFTPLTSSAVGNNILFTGRHYDTETKLYYYRARTYHPYLGRFLQRDPLGEAASAKKSEQPGKQLTIKLDIYKDSNSWTSQDMMTSMLKEAVRIFKGRDITLTDVNGEIDPAHFAVKEVDAHGETLGPEEAQQYVGGPGGENTIKVMFAHSAEGAGCNEGIGCSSSDLNTITIGESLAKDVDGHAINNIKDLTGLVGKGPVSQVLAHEIGHQFGLHHSGEDDNGVLLPQYRNNSAQYKKDFQYSLMFNQLMDSKAATFTAEQLLKLKSLTVLP
jgi:RHS repeat-associated protein